MVAFQAALVDIRIDVVTLEGFEHLDGNELKQELAAELELLFRDIPSGWTTNEAIAELNAGPIRLSAQDDARSIAAGIARALREGLEG